MNNQHNGLNLHGSDIYTHARTHTRFF